MKKKMQLIKSMALTQKGLKSAKDKGGFFYFVTDPKGEQSALMVLGVDKDPDGSTTFRKGRGLLKDFKGAHPGVKAAYAQGGIVSGSPLVFEVQKGNAKPTIIKKAFKKSPPLKTVLGGQMSLLKNAKIVMGGAKEKVAANSKDLDDWKNKPETQRLIAELGLSGSEIEDLFLAEQAHAQYAAHLPTSLDEETLLQERQAETEVQLDQLSTMEEKAQKLMRSDPEGAQLLEAEINQKRIALAKNNSNGPDPFVEGQLNPIDKAVFQAAIQMGMELLLARLESTKQAIEIEKALVARMNENNQEEAQARLEKRRSEVILEIEAIQEQLQATL